MVGLKSTKTHHEKLELGILIVLFYLYLHLTYAAFPLERDVAEFAGVLPTKKWIVFMEKVANSCFNEIKRNISHTLTDVVMCMAKEKRTPKCMINFGSKRCKLVRIFPNILKYEYFYHPKIRVIVHRQFSINITILGLRGENGRLHLTFVDMEKMYFYRGPLYAFTFVNPYNAIELKFNKEIKHETFIEYGVVQSFNVTRFQQIRATPMYFQWSYLLVTCFHIQVDIAARLILDATLCSRCKLLVYDGPNERLPVIMKLNNAVKAQKVVTSTFQVFFIVIESHPQQKSLTYESVYRSTSVFNLSNVEHENLNFNNNTYCKGHSMIARQCVYTFYTHNWETIRFSLTDLKFTGEYQDTKFLAGIVLFNNFFGKREKIYEITKQFQTSESTYIDIIGTGNKMEIVVFVYSVFASLAMKCVMTATTCTTLLVTNYSISYTRYISPVDHTNRIFEIKNSVYELFQSTGCLRIQSIWSTYSFKFSLPRSTLGLIKIMPLIYPYKYPEPLPCTASLRGFGFRYRLDFSSNIIHTVTSIEMNCADQYNDFKTIGITQLPCKVPCTCLQERVCPLSEILWRPNDTNACDICQLAHVYVDQQVHLKPNVYFHIRMKSNACSFVKLTIGSNYLGTVKRPYFNFEINLPVSKMISRTPDFRFAVSINIWLSDECPYEITLAALPSLSEMIEDLEEPSAMVKSAYWRGCFYRSFSRVSAVSWDTAATACQRAGQYLLTIHSAEEFTFIAETFLQPYDMSILYGGIKREVLYLYNVTIE